MPTLRVIVLALSCIPLFGFLNSYTSPAYTDDPALCSSEYPDACDPGIAAALADFPYWNYRATALGGGTQFFLGTSDGYLWGLTCQHCGKNTAEWTLTDGPAAGQVFDTVGYSGGIGSGAYRQFGNGDNPPVGSGDLGDMLYRMSPKPGESLPSMPFVRLLPSLDMLKDATLILSIGNGTTHTHPTLGWFTECSTSVDGGMPASGRPACCTDERWAGNYGPSWDDRQCTLPFNHNPNSPNYPAKPACWGGEGDFEACTQAGLQYLGPVWATGGFHWATSDFWNNSVSWITAYSTGHQFLHYQRTLVDGQSQIPGTGSAVENGYCVERLTTVTSAGVYVATVPPTSPVKSHLMCGAKPVSDPPEVYGYAPESTAIQGDSGSADFAYVNGVWYFIAMGASPANGLFSTTPETNRADWAAWVYGSTQDADGDGVQDFSDNCVNVPNGDPLNAPFNQIDGDGDGYGNICDGDFDQSGLVDGADWNTIPSCLFQAPGPGANGPPEDPTCAESDLDGSGFVDGNDVTLFFPLLFTQPGPSGPACSGVTGPCVP